MRKLLCLFMVMLLILGGLAGCSGKTTGNADDTDKKTSDESLKVAVILPGSINDGGWCASAYEGLKLIEKNYGAEIAYNENTAISDYDEVFRMYATNGYDVIFGHGGEFGDSAKRIGKEFPDVQFCVTSTDISQEPNVSSLNNDSLQQGFLQGAVAAVVSKTGVVGAIGGMNIPSISDSIVGFEAGAKYVNPDITVYTTMTGSFDDAAKAKEVAISMINKKADILMQNADKAGLGVIEACTANKIYSVGSIGDQANLAPDTIITSGIANMPVAFDSFIKTYLAEGVTAKCYMMGMAENVIYLAPYYKFDSILTDEQKAAIKKVSEDILNGDLVVNDYVKK